MAQENPNQPEEVGQNPDQRKMSLAGSEQALTVIDLMKDCMTVQNSLIGKSQWDTIVNALTLEVESSMLRKMVDLLEEIRKGSLHKPKE